MPSRATGAPDDVCVERAIARSGHLGITVKQISTETEIPEPRVTGELHRLARRSQVTRIGRGLWMLSEFGQLPAHTPTFRGPSDYLGRFSRRFGVELEPHPEDIQFNPNEGRPVHRWWPYVQGFSAEFVEGVCRAYGAGPGTTVLDPFCGSGTVPVVARSLGAQGIGVDMMPITAFVARAKQEWSVDPDALLRRAAAVLGRRPARLPPPPFLRETPRHFDPAVLRSLLRLKASLQDEPAGPATELLRLAFSGILIDSSHLKRSPCLGYGPKPGLGARTPDLLFEAGCRRIAEDLRTLRRDRRRWGPRARILQADAGRAALGRATVDLAITSPPYVNGMDYVTNYKLDLAWMDYARSYRDLVALRSSMVACDNIPKRVARSAKLPPELEGTAVSEVVGGIERNLRSKATYRRDDMGSIVAKYFADLVPVLRNVHRALRTDARFVVVNGDSFLAGTYVPGDLIFAEIAANLGFRVEKLVQARTRRSGQRRGFLLRESVLTLRKA